MGLNQKDWLNELQVDDVPQIMPIKEGTVVVWELVLDVTKAYWAVCELRPRRLHELHDGP